MKTETIVLDIYPWAEPTDEQKRMFDALPLTEKRRMIDQAIADGFDDPLSEKTVDEVIAESKTDREE